MEKIEYARTLGLAGKDYFIKLNPDEIEKIEMRKKEDGHRITFYLKIGFFILEIKDYELAPALETISGLGLTITEFKK